MKLKNLVLLLFLPFALLFPENSRANGAANGSLFGRVQDANTQQPVGWAHLHLLELEAGVVAHADGAFHFLSVPEGDYTLRVTHLGYRDLLQKVRIAASDTLCLLVDLSPHALDLEEVDVVVEHHESDGSVHHDPLLSMRGGALQRNLGTTIAETVNEEPGIAQRSMGPAPSRPVLRGLGGDRLLMVEDGQRTGDLSATSADHAVAIEPLTAERIELIRGPETLLYGPGILGGVINVERNAIQRLKLHRIQGSATLQAESVNEGFGGGAELSAPVGPFAIRLDGSLRDAKDINTPDGRLGNTGIATGNGSVGISLPVSWGVLGVSGTIYDTEYGIPGGFVGAHPNGVDIEMDRRNYAALAQFNLGNDVFRRWETEYSHARYYHAEFESNGALGIEFGVVTDHLTSKLHLGPHLFFDDGVFGVWGEYRDYATGGYTFTPATSEQQAAVFLYEQKRIGDTHVQAAIRYDWRDIDPDREIYSVTIDTIQQREFSGFSASLGVERPFADGMTIGATAMRSFRAPGVEELFSRGPHLAAYSYEIGNPNLQAETGTGGEVFVKLRKRGWTGRLAAFINAFDNYIFPAFTGQRSLSRSDLYEYRYDGADALMTGVEGNLEWQPWEMWTFHSSLSYVRGALTERDVPMPQMPPLSGRFGVDWKWDAWTVGALIQGASAQERLYVADDPDAREEDPTAAWARLDLHLQYTHPWQGLLHTMSVGILNVTDASYRNHLSRVRSVMPEPGRNIKLGYKMYW